MILDIDISLPLTLGCGQAHRWQRQGDVWEGVVDGKVLLLRPREGGVEAIGHLSRSRIMDYLRADDDLDAIYGSVAVDALMRDLTARYRGLRLLRQDPWECLATYLLAVNANVKRIGSMVEGLCRTFGDDLGGRHAFPRAEQIWERHQELDACRLGYRCQRMRSLAASVANGELVPDELRGLSYDECVHRLKNIPGVGDKVADCVALFSMDHLQAFPVDARIGRSLRENYGVSGSYHRCSAFGRGRFGPYAGYAQELLYQSEGESSWLGQTQAGGL
ncbi:MAG: DNA glycosylase [Candidatus Methanomethylophilaceae archaeon]|nr:DNA glycosylase [Candidatus Methanomethylophilaceae archaeon]